MARWLLQLRLAQKFLILGLVALVMVAVPTTLYVLDVVGELRHTEQQAQGMPPLMAVNRAVQHLQVHRGTSAGMLGGNETMASRRPAVRDAVQQAMGEAQSALQAAHAPAALLQRLQGMNQRWVELEQAVASRSVQAPQSMQRHTQLVMAMLELGEAVRDTYGLMLVPEADDQALVQALLVQAPLLSENLGLLRGQGAGFLAQGNLPPENRGSLRALQRRVAELQGDMARPLERAMQLNSSFRSHLGPAYETLRSHTDASLQMASTQLVDAETLTLASPVFFDTLTRAIESINALSNQGAQVLAGHMDGSVAAYRHQMLWVLGLLALALVASIWLAMVFVRSITQPLSRAVALAQSVAQGDLSGEDEVPARNEVGDLVAAQQQMRAKLRPMVAQVRRGADSVALASAEIAQGNMDLSGRTEQQASALEQTAASMEELSTTVRHNADNARTASELAESAREVAEQGGNVVARVVETMQGINEGSRRIADIIGVIDGIAFQTNILALNAAVEAARAGEQGRGFAVVASEVRSLAQRSADAAKEIKQLIESSVARVGEGNVLANQAGQTMGEVVAAIQKVSSIVAAISDASQQQADGVRQVGEAVTEMDQTTQQNAALVEEMASAANSLSVQGRQLVEAVAVFRWNGEATAPAAVAVRTEALPVHAPTPAVRATKAQQAALAEH